MHKFKSIIPTIAAMLLFSSAANATVTLTFGQTGVARASGFGDKDATVSGTNGLRWSIVISTANAAFEASNTYDPIVDLNVSQFLTTNNGLTVTDDYYFAHPLSLLTVNGSATGTGGDLGGAGSITSITGVPFGSNSISQNDPFGVIWFDTVPAAGSNYGLFTDPAFTIPADSANVSFASTVFAGNDPIKPASSLFAGATIVPEPSRMVLAGLGLMGLMFRRRRA